MQKSVRGEYQKDCTGEAKTALESGSTALVQSSVVRSYLLFYSTFASFYLSDTACTFEQIVRDPTLAAQWLAKQVVDKISQQKPLALGGEGGLWR
jgi:hypothetical protein